MWNPGRPAPSRAGLYALMAIAAVNLASAYEGNADAFTRSVLEQISAKVEPCAGSPVKQGSGLVKVCARWASDFESFSKAWDQTAASPDKVSVVARPVSEWLTQVGGRIRWYAVGDKWVVVTFDPERRIVVSYAKDKDGVLPLGKNVTPPRRIPIDYTSGDVRREARQGVRPEATGVVVMSAVIRKDGTVADVEVLGCLPQNRGLEQAATGAIRKWRYEPAMKDGVPVNVSMVSAFTYGPGGTFRVSDGSDYKESGQNRPAAGSSPRGAP